MYQFNNNLPRFKHPPLITHKQLRTIYALERSLGIKPTWDPKMSRRMAADKINDLKGRTSGQLGIF